MNLRQRPKTTVGHLHKFRLFYDMKKKIKFSFDLASD